MEQKTSEVPLYWDEPLGLGRTHDEGPQEGSRLLVALSSREIDAALKDRIELVLLHPITPS